MPDRFMTTIEVVPPPGSDAGAVLDALETLGELPFGGFSIATNPVAKPRMNALALCALVQQRTGKPAILHCTTRDHNRLSLQGLLWGAQALGIDTVLVMTGDFVALGDRARTTTVRDLDVFDLIRMAREAGLQTGVVLEHFEEAKRQERSVHRLEKKVAAGAQFVVTQPVYDTKRAEMLAGLRDHIGLPITMGILPLRSPRHAEFLHGRVAGIEVPQHVRERMARAQDPIAEGAAQASEMLAVARQHFAGVCIMPPFNHYEILFDIFHPK